LGILLEISPWVGSRHGLGFIQAAIGAPMVLSGTAAVAAESSRHGSSLSSARRERADLPVQAPTTARLLHARRERPRRRTAAQQRDELAPFHCTMSPVLPTDRIAHLGGPGDRCTAGFQVESDA